MRNFLVSVAFCSEFAFSRDVLKKAGLCNEERTFLSWKSKIWTFLDFLLTQWLSLASFYVEFLAVLKKFNSLFGKTQPFFFGKNQFLRLWKNLLFQSHSAANLLLLAVFKKGNSFRKTYLFFLKNQFLKSLRKFVISVAFCSKFSTFRNNWKKAGFFLEKSINLWWKNYILNVSRNFVFSVALYGILLTFSDFKKVENNFFRKAICLFKQPNFCTFWETSLSQSFLRQIFYVEILAVLKKFNLLFRKTQSFFLKNPIFKAMKKFNIPVAFCSKIATFNDFLNCDIFSGKPSNVFFNKSHFSNVFKNFTHAVAFYGKLETFGNFR